MTAPRDPTEARTVAQIEARIEAALAQLGTEHEPPAGWEARVLAAVRTAPPRRPWWKIAVPALTLATAAAVVVVGFFLQPGPFRLEVVAETPAHVRGAPQGPVRMLGDKVEVRAVHDVVHVTVSGGPGRRAIRVYRDETELVMACPGNPACRASGDGIAVDLTLDKVGTYAIVAIAAGDALPAMPGTYDGDTAAAIRAKAARAERKLHVQ